MNAEAVVAVSALVVTLTQLAKWSNVVSDQRGPIVILALSLLGTIVWAYSLGPMYDRAQLFPYVAGWAAVATSAAGVFGFTRSLPAAVTEGSRNSPMPGAGQSSVQKPGDFPERRDQ